MVDTPYQFGVDDFKNNKAFFDGAHITVKSVTYGSHMWPAKDATDKFPAKPETAGLMLSVIYTTAKNGKDVTTDYSLGVDYASVTVSSNGHIIIPVNQKTFRLPKGTDGFFWITRFIDTGAIPKSAFKGDTSVFEGYKLVMESLKNPNSSSDYQKPYPLMVDTLSSQPASTTTNAPSATPQAYAPEIDATVLVNATEALRAVMSKNGKATRNSLTKDLQGYATEQKWTAELRSQVALALYNPTNLSFIASNAGYKLTGEEISA